VHTTTNGPAESGRWRALAVLSFAIVLTMSTWFSAAAVVPQLRAEWDLSPSASAWLTIAVQLGFAAGALASSALNMSDLLAPKYVIVAGSFGAAAANFLMQFAGGVGAGIGLRFATGIFLAGVYPPAMKLMSTWFQRDRGLALGVLIGAMGLGNGMPHLINGLGGLDWHVVILVTSAQAVAGGLIAGLAVREGPYPFPAARFDPSQVWRMFTNRGVRLACFGYFGHMWELFALYAWFLIFFSQALAARGRDVGSSSAFATFAVIAMGAVGAAVGGILADRWGRTRTTALMMVVSGSCSLLIGLFFGSPSSGVSRW
jgi:MFS family permease